jgi:hypothetical protein
MSNARERRKESAVSNALTVFEEDQPHPRRETLPIAELKRHADIPLREIDVTIVREYQEHMEAGYVFPPITVFRDTDGSPFWIDGTHRIEAARRLDRESIDALVQNGGKREALLAWCGTNATHGLRRSIEEKRDAVNKLLADPEWGKWSAREIARRCHVSPTFVTQEKASLYTYVQTSLSTVDSKHPQQVVKFRNKHGDIATMNVSYIGGSKPLTLKIMRPATQAAEPMPFGLPEINRLDELIEMAKTADPSYRPQLRTAARKLAKIVGWEARPRFQKPKRP